MQTLDWKAGAVIVLAVGLVTSPAKSLSYGAAAYQTVRYCNGLAADVSCMSPANPDRTIKESFLVGGVGAGLHNTANPASGGEIVSDVSFGELDMPVIKSGVWAGDDTRVGSNITTFMGFRFEGEAPAEFALDVLIDWETSGAPLASDDWGDYAGEGMGVFTLYLFGAESFPNLTTASEIIAFQDSWSFTIHPDDFLGSGWASMNVSAPGYHEAVLTLGTGNDGNPLTLNPGSEYVVLGYLQNHANRSGWIDATNTVRVQLSNTLSDEARANLLQNIVTARSTVPEPATWAMLIAGFGIVGAAARRRREAVMN